MTTRRTWIPKPGDRARLIQPVDQPDYETLTELSEEQVAALEPRFHTPVWTESTPGAFCCAVCWGDGWGSEWPCATARKHGAEVFEQ